MKLPVPLIWRIIGDFFNREVFFDDEKRAIDSLWQVMAENSAQLLSYIDEYRKEKNVFEVEPFAPWGTFGSIARPIGQSLDIDGVLLGGRQDDFWNWFLYTKSDDVPPSSGYIEVFSSSGEITPCASLPYDSVTYDVLDSGGSVIRTSGAEFTSGVPWAETENPSYVFGQDTVLDGSGRWRATGSRLPTAEIEGLEFNTEWTNWAILQDQYYFDASQNWRQVWRLKVLDWEPTALERTISLTSFGDTGKPFEVRLTSEGGNVTVGMGLYALTRQEVLAFSGNTISRPFGSFLSDGFLPGMTVVVSGTASNDGTYTIASATTTTITTTESLSAEVTGPEARLRSDLEAAIGNTNSWQGKLEVANANEPLFVEIVMSYTASTANLTSSVWLDGEQAVQATAYKVPPGRRKHTLDVFNQYKEMLVEIAYVIGEGKLWNAQENIDFSSSIGEAFTYKYQIDEPIVDSGLIRSEPWDLAPEAEVISQTTNELTLELNEDWANYAPEYVRIFNNSGQWVTGKLKSQNGVDVVYEIILQCDLTVDLEGVVRLHPWYLNPSEFTWVDTGIFGTSQPIPYEDRDSWYLQSIASEVNLYERYGKILGIGYQPDSQEYLDIIRGFQYGLLTPPTEYHTERAVGVMSGLPYVVGSGTLTSVTRFRDELGASLYDEVVVGGRAYKINPLWDDSNLLMPVGSFIPFMSPMVDGVRVFHYLNDIDKIQSVIDSVWKTWGTFLVQIPANVGVNEFSVKEIVAMLDRKKDKDTDFIVEYISDVSENFGSGDDDFLTDPDTHEVYAHTIEDMLFDDDGTVYQNAMNYQWQKPENASEYEEIIAENFSTVIHGWPLQETAGTNAEDVVGDADGTHDGDVVVGSGGEGNKFTYSADYSFDADTETSVPNTNWVLDMGTGDDFTITAWLKVNATGTVDGVFSKHDGGSPGTGIKISLSASDFLSVDLTDSASTFTRTTATTVVDVDDWVLAAVRVDRANDELQIWLVFPDGTVETTAALDITTCGDLTTSSAARIGDADGLTGIDGNIAHVYTFQSALSEQEIYSLWRAQGGLFSEEYQFTSTSQLDDGDTMDQFVNLDGDHLVLNDVRYLWSGNELGPAPSRPAARYIYRDSGVFLKGELSQTERNNGLSKNTLRFAKPNTYQQHWYRPYELCTLYTSASPEFSMRDGGGTLYTYPTPVWEDRSVGGMSGLLLEAAWLQNTNWVVVAGENGAIFTSDNYGHTWTDRSVSIGVDDFHGISATSTTVWIVGDNDRVYTQTSESAAPASDSIDAGYDHKDIFFLDDATGWTASDDATDSYVIKTTDGGATWGAPVQVVTNDLAKSVHFIDADNGWFATDAGLFRTDDGGATWSASLDAASFESVIMLDIDTVIGVGLGGVRRATTNATDVSPSFETPELPGTPGDLRDIWYDGTEVFIVGGTGASVGQIYRLRPTGVWELTTEGTEPFYGVFAIRPFERMIVRDGEAFRWL